MTEAQRTAGWYEDPQSEFGRRYHDGTEWTGYGADAEDLPAPGPDEAPPATLPYKFQLGAVRWGNGIGLAIVPAIGALGGFAIATADPDVWDDTARLVGAVVGCLLSALAAWLIWRGVRTALIVRDDGVEARRYLRTYHLSWSEIEWFGWAAPGFGTMRRHPALALVIKRRSPDARPTPYVQVTAVMFPVAAPEQVRPLWRVLQRECRARKIGLAWRGDLSEAERGRHRLTWQAADTVGGATMTANRQGLR